MVITRYVPTYLPSALKRIDPALSLRWSKEKQRHALEMKIPGIARRFYLKRGIPKEPVRHWEFGRFVLPENSDLRIRYKLGHIGVLYIGKPDENLLYWLYYHDTQRSRNFIRELEEKERREELSLERSNLDELDQISSEGYDRMKYQAGERISMRR